MDLEHVHMVSHSSKMVNSKSLTLMIWQYYFTLKKREILLQDIKRHNYHSSAVN